jgi:hypothetical protein
VGLAICLAGGAGTPTLDDPNIVLTRAELSSQDVVDCPDGPAIVDACWRLTLKVREVLIGTTDQHDISIGRFGAQLAPDAEFFVLERRNSGSFDVIDWKNARAGACFGADTTKELSQAERQKVDYWRAKFPCR